MLRLEGDNSTELDAFVESLSGTMQMPVNVLLMPYVKERHSPMPVDVDGYEGGVLEDIPGNERTIYHVWMHDSGNIRQDFVTEIRLGEGDADSEAASIESVGRRYLVERALQQPDRTPGQLKSVAVGDGSIDPTKDWDENYVKISFDAQEKPLTIDYHHSGANGEASGAILTKSSNRWVVERLHPQTQPVGVDVLSHMKRIEEIVRKNALRPGSIRTGTMRPSLPLVPSHRKPWLN